MDRYYHKYTGDVLLYIIYCIINVVVVIVIVIVVVIVVVVDPRNLLLKLS